MVKQNGSRSVVWLCLNNGEAVTAALTCGTGFCLHHLKLCCAFMLSCVARLKLLCGKTAAPVWQDCSTCQCSGHSCRLIIFLSPDLEQVLTVRKLHTGHFVLSGTSSSVEWSESCGQGAAARFEAAL